MEEVAACRGLEAVACKGLEPAAVQILAAILAFDSTNLVVGRGSPSLVAILAYRIPSEAVRTSITNRSPKLEPKDNRNPCEAGHKHPAVPWEPYLDFEVN